MQRMQDFRRVCCGCVVQRHNSYRNPQPCGHRRRHPSFPASYIITTGLYTAGLFTRRPTKRPSQHGERFGFQRCSIFFAVLLSNCFCFAYLLSRQHKPAAAAASRLKISNNRYSIKRLKDFCITRKKINFLSTHPLHPRYQQVTKTTILSFF